ncbi:MAG: response regulator transcription factor [Candidatus Acidiferrales bacterium]
MRLLVSETDPELGTYIQRSFDAERYAVDLTHDPQAMFSLLRDREYDLAILDISVPNASTLEVLQDVRAARRQLPILVLTNRGQLEDSARVFEMGADDFVLSPFVFSELSARVRALLQRGDRSPDSVWRLEDLELNRVAHLVTRAGQVIDLTPKEFSLLEYLLRNAGRRVTRAQIIENVWNLSSASKTNVVDVYINYVRKKVDAQAECKLIHTIRGVGYQLQPQGCTAGRPRGGVPLRTT